MEKYRKKTHNFLDVICSENVHCCRNLFGAMKANSVRPMLPFFPFQNFPFLPAMPDNLPHHPPPHHPLPTLRYRTLLSIRTIAYHRMMLTMSHPSLLLAPESRRCAHSLAPAWYLLPYTLTHTTHFRHHFIFWYGHRRTADMHTHADLSTTA